MQVNPALGVLLLQGWWLDITKLSSFFLCFAIYLLYIFSLFSLFSASKAQSGWTFYWPTNQKTLFIQHFIMAEAFFRTYCRFVCKNINNSCMTSQRGRALLMFWLPAEIHVTFRHEFQWKQVSTCNYFIDFLLQKRMGKLALV